MMTPADNHAKGMVRLVIGVGNAYRSDDGVGIHVIRRLKEMNIAGLTLVESAGEGAALMATWKGADAVILVDAVRSSGSPGLIHRLDAYDRNIPSDFFHYSTHAFSVAEAVELARALGELPSRFVIYGIEGVDFSAGTTLSPQVAHAADQVVRNVPGEWGDRVHRYTAKSYGTDFPVCQAFGDDLK